MRVELPGVVHLSVEEVPGPTMVLSDETVIAAPAVRVATVERVEMDDPEFQRQLKKFKEIQSLQFIVDLAPGRHRVRISFVFEVEPAQVETF